MQNDDDAGITLTAQQVCIAIRLLEKTTNIFIHLVSITVRAKRWFQVSEVTPEFAKNWIVEFLAKTEEDITIAIVDIATILEILNPYPEV